MEQKYTPLGIGSGSRIADRYEVVRRLGAGAMSVVYVVADLSLNREQVALKLLSSNVTEDPNYVERFRNEMLLTRKLTHPNIVRTHEFGQSSSGQYYITMELVDGISLEQLLEMSNKAVDISECVYYLVRIVEGIAYAHENEVIHRDLKPGNVLVSRKGEVKIADFGLARSMTVDNRLTKVGDCVGTPAYMAPEQVLEKELDGRTDVYALGVIAFELLTSRVPFKGDTWFALAEKIIQDPLPDLSTLRKGVSPWLKDFVEKATQKQAKDRYSSMCEVLEVLSPHASSSDFNKTEVYRNSARKSALSHRTKKLTALQSANVGIDWLRITPVLFYLSIGAGVLLCLAILISEAPKSIRKVTQGNTQFKELINETSKAVTVLRRSMENMERFERIEQLLEEQKIVGEPVVVEEQRAAQKPDKPTSEEVLSENASSEKPLSDDETKEVKIPVSKN